MSENRYREILFGTCKTTSLTRCEKCNSSELRVSEITTRSADEPVTIFIKCHKCNYVKCER